MRIQVSDPAAKPRTLDYDNVGRCFLKPSLSYCGTDATAMLVAKNGGAVTACVACNARLPSAFTLNMETVTSH